MLAENIAENLWYWFCEQDLPNGKRCKAINMKCKTKEQALREFSAHVRDVQHKD